MFAEKLEQWTDRLTVVLLPNKWAWASQCHQLWARLQFDLGCNSSSVDNLESREIEGGALCKLYRKILPYLGVNRNVKSGWRWMHLHSTFRDIVLHKILTETLIARINLFLQHYATPFTIGETLNTSLQSQKMEAGTNICALLTPYHPLEC